MKLARFLGLLFAMTLAAGSAQAQQCLHGPDEIAAQKERKQLALGVVRFINTAQMVYYAKFSRFATWSELATSPILDEARAACGPNSLSVKASRVMSFSAESEILPGFEFRLATNGETYWLLLRDKTDPCLFSLYSDQEGVIYYGQPIDRPPSTSPLD